MSMVSDAELARMIKQESAYLRNLRQESERRQKAKLEQAKRAGDRARLLRVK